MRRRRGIFTRCGRFSEAFESLEVRMPLAADFTFTESLWPDTLGHADVVTAIGDLDGDGADDFVASGVEIDARDPAGASNAWYRLDKNTNSLQWAGNLPARDGIAGSYRTRAAIDMDGDGDRDVLLEVRSSNGVDGWIRYEWMENSDGLGNFTTLHPVISGTILGVQAADLDRDGDDDLSYADYRQSPPTVTFGWLENTGGNFQKHELYSGPDSARVMSLYDPDGDGSLVIPRLAPTVDGSMSFDLNGDQILDEISVPGKWQTNADLASQTFRALPGSTSSSVARPNDVDQDGDTDVWMQNGATLQLLLNDGTGSFTVQPISQSVQGTLYLAQLDADAVHELMFFDPLTHRFVWSDFDVASQNLTLHEGKAPAREVAQAVADINGDGRMDVVGLRGWYEGTSQGGDFPLHVYPESLQPQGVRPLDVDRDGRVDLVFYTEEAGFPRRRVLQWSRQNEDGTWATPSIIDNRVVAGDLGTWEMELLDVDRDGDLDLLTLSSLANATRSIEWYENVGGAEPIVARGVFAQSSGITSLDNLVDLDGDGDLDITVSFPTYHWAERTSDGTYVVRATIDSVQISASLGTDIDRDGDNDLVVATEDRVQWYENTTGKGDFRVAQPIGQLHGNGLVSYFGMLDAQDLNGDGRLDLLIGQRSQSGIEFPSAAIWDYQFYHSLKGRNEFELSGAPWGNRGELALVADLTGDGRAELFETPREGSGIIAHLNTTNPASPTGDVNRDGEADLWDIDELCAALAQPSSVSRYDVNGDGKVDLDDHRYLVREVLKIEYGDANGDGDFDSTDLVQLFAAGGYEQDQWSGWKAGDWNCDGRFTSADLVLGMQESSYESEQTDPSVFVHDELTNRLVRYHAVTGDYLGEVTSIPVVDQMLVTKDNELLIIRTGQLERWTTGGTLIESVNLQVIWATMSMDPSGQVFVKLDNGQVKRLEITNGQMNLVTLPMGLANFATISAGPDGKLYSSSNNQSLLQYDITTGQLERIVVTSASPFGSFTVGPDGSAYLTVNDTSSVVPTQRIEKYDVQTGALQKVLVSGLSNVLELKWAGSGRLLVRTYDDLRLLNTETGEWLDVIAQVGNEGIRRIGAFAYWPGGE